MENIGKKTISELKSINKQLREEEKFHEELHQEAESEIIELKEALREQENNLLQIQYQSTKVIQVLENRILFLKQQLREK